MLEENRIAKPEWLNSAWLDLMIGCGAWSLPLLLLAGPLGSSMVWLSATFYLLSLVCNYPHYMATIYRAYRKREDFNKYQIFTLHLTILIVAALALAHWSHRLLVWVFTLYVCWSPWHYMGQNFGLLMMFARRSGAQPRQRDRNAINLAFIASYLMLLVSFHTGASNDPMVISLGLPADLARLIKILLFVVFIIAGAYGLMRLAAQMSWRAWTAPALIFLTEFLWFVMPSIASLYNNIPLTQIRYSSGILAFMHSAQYLWITSFYARREAQTSAVAWRPGKYFAALVIGGIILFVPGPWLASRALHLDFGVSFLAFTALVNIHHFLLDGAIWKLRESRIFALLVDTRAEATMATEKAEAIFTAIAVWISSRSLPARILRIAAIVALLLLAGIDQTKFMLGLNENNSARLAQAAALNPYDANIKMRLALALASTKGVDETVAGLEQAIRIDPYNAEAQNQLARLLIDNGRYQQAYQHYQQMIKYAPDANAFINLGILCAQLNHLDEAIGYWQKAVVFDPKQKNAYLYIAETYFRQGDFARANINYEQYLVIATNEPAEQRPHPRDIVTVVLKLAESYQHTEHPERSIKYCQKAVGISEQIGDKPLTSTALVASAKIFANFGDQKRAIFAFQNALKLDAIVGDDKTSAIDWFNYGQLLQQFGAKKSLIYACWLNAEALLKDSAGSELAEIKQARTEIERDLDTETATKTRNDLAAVIGEALTLQF